MDIKKLLNGDKLIVGDFETDGLDPTVIHCAVFRSYPGGQEFIFEQQEAFEDKIIELFDSVDYIIGHNFMGYDYPRVMQKLMKVEFDDKKIIDTLILSRMQQFDRLGGHGLEAWGERLGVAKPKVEQWSLPKDDLDIIEYFERDI